jgi:hypothetical protein
MRRLAIPAVLCSLGALAYLYVSEGTAGRTRGGRGAGEAEDAVAVLAVRHCLDADLGVV